MEILVGFLAVVIIFSGMVFLFVRRGLQMRELCDHGVETVGTITDKRAVRPDKSRSRQKKLVYRYQDSQGNHHEHTSVVSWEVYGAHEVGGTIPVIYSSKNPAVSAPKYLVELSQRALGRASDPT